LKPGEINPQSVIYVVAFSDERGKVDNGIMHITVGM